MSDTDEEDDELRAAHEAIEAQNPPPEGVYLVWKPFNGA